MFDVLQYMHFYIMVFVMHPSNRKAQKSGMLCVVCTAHTHIHVIKMKSKGRVGMFSR